MNTHNRFRQTVESWDAHYDQVGDIRGYEIIRRGQLACNSLLNNINNSQALIIDVGCGTGRILKCIIQQRPSWQGIGLDLSIDMVAACQENYFDEPRLRFQQFDIENGYFPYQADAILALGVIGYLQNVPHAFRSIHKMLKPDGIFIFSTNKPSAPRQMTHFYRQVARSHPFRNRAFSLRQTTIMMRHMFEILETYDYCYLPYIPFLRRLVPISRGFEQIFGKIPTLLSSTTLFIVKRLNNGD